MNNWKMLHQEAPSGSVNIESWHNADKNALLFIRDNAGVDFTVYQTVEDAAGDNRDFALADVCYGWYNFLFESYGGRTMNAHDDFLDDCWERSARFSGREDAFACHESMTECEDTFHAWQVYNDNEECEGCDACTAHGAQS